MPSLRRRQGTLREGEITPHRTTMSVFECHPINILAKENPNSFARMSYFREIRAISHQSSHPRRKTSHFFCKDSHPARYHVRNSPHFKLPQDTTQRKHPETLRRGTESRNRALPRTRRKENIPKLCVATQNYATEHSRGHDAKKAAQNSASRHRTTQQSTPENTTQRKLLKTLRCDTELRSRALPRTRRKESCSKLCVATQNHATEHSRGHEAKKSSRNSASWHRTTQQSTPEDTTQRKLLKTLRRGTEPRSRALPRTRRKENIPKLCVATQNHATEHSRGHDAKKAQRDSGNPTASLFI